MKSGVSANQLWTQVPVASRTVSLGAGAAGTIKSIQRGTMALATSSTALTVDATLSPAVVVANTEVRWMGVIGSVPVSSWGTGFMYRLHLEDTTTVRATRGYGQNTGATFTVAFEITEWY